MKPLTVITGIILGSSSSIFIGLTVVLFLFAVVGQDDPRVQDQFSPLIQSTLVFLLLTGVSVWSFITLVREHRTRWWAQLALWLSLGVMLLFMRQLIG